MKCRRALWLLAPILMACMMTSCGKKAEVAETPAAAVEAVAVEPRDFVISYRGPAQLEGWKSSDLGAEQNGRIMWIGVEEGDRVKKGEAIVRVDASVQTARSTEAQARISDARAAAKNATDNFERVRMLFDEGVASQQELDNALAARDRANEAVSAAMAAAGAVAGDLGKTTIRAPFDGVVTMKSHEVGEVVGSNSRIVRVEDLSALKAVVSVPEREIAGIAVGSSATLTLSTGVVARGKVSLVAPAADQLSRTVKVEIRIETAAAEFKSGLFAEASIERAVIRGALLVPRAALARTSDGAASVFVEENGIAKKRSVRLGGSDDYLFVIEEGIRPGDRVITSGVSRLVDGMKVRVVDPAARSASVDSAPATGPGESAASRATETSTPKAAAPQAAEPTASAPTSPQPSSRAPKSAAPTAPAAPAAPGAH